MTLEKASADFNIGDRLFVDMTQRDPSAGGLFVYQGKDGIITPLEHIAGAKPSSGPGNLLGKVIGVFRLI